MKILKHLKVPTGDILVVQGVKGKLEMVSLGDYGQEHNLKCNAIGLDRDLDKVEHTCLLPLTEKWVITISTQYGCSMGCIFCDVPQVGPGKNATYLDLKNQLLTGVLLHPEIKTTKRLNIHFARMGEPTWNRNVIYAIKWAKKNLDPKYKIHPVVSTMMPRKNERLQVFINDFMEIKNGLLDGDAGLQLSINSTSDKERETMFNGNACTFSEIATIMKGIIPLGRKITLNFAIADYKIDPNILLNYFDPNHYIIKLTPMHKTGRAVDSGIVTKGDYTKYYPYQEHEEALIKAGYDVLVFIASKEEDLGLITCGNVVLSGAVPRVQYTDEFV